MSDSARAVDVLVVGGGIVGLAVAWRAAGRGMSVTVLERDSSGQGASHVAAGMLAPVSEVEFGRAGRRVLELGLRSAAMWPAFAAEVHGAAERERQVDFRESLGLEVERLRPSQAREREPALAPTIRLALEAPEDHSVDPRLALCALRRACVSAGVQLREHAPVARLELDRSSSRVSGVTLIDRERIEGEQVGMGAGG